MAIGMAWSAISSSRASGIRYRSLLRSLPQFLPSTRSYQVNSVSVHMNCSSGFVNRCLRPRPSILQNTRSQQRWYRGNLGHKRRTKSQNGFRDTSDYQTDGPSGVHIQILRPILWSIVFISGTYYLCAESYAENREKLRKSAWDIFGSFMMGTTENMDVIRSIMNDPDVLHLVNGSHNVHSESHAKTLYKIAKLPGWVPRELKRTIVIFSDKWYSLSRGERCIYTIVGINAAVFGMWHIPRLMPFMTKHFLHDPRKGRSYTMLTSTFSHMEVWHLLFNSIALVSFSIPVVSAMGPEHFVAFYLSAGVISSLVSQLASPLRRALILPSLGASGAVYAVVGATMMLYPDSKISLIFLPFIPISIGHAFPALLAYDLAGVVLGWRTFNHISHLTGGLFGIGYIAGITPVWSWLVRSIEIRRERSRSSQE